MARRCDAKSLIACTCWRMRQDKRRREHICPSACARMTKVYTFVQRGDAPAAQPAPAAPKPAAAPAPVAAPPAAQPVPAAPVVKKGFFSSAPAAARERAATAPTGAAAAAGGPVTLQDARKRRQEIAMQRPIQGKLDAELDQVFPWLCIFISAVLLHLLRDK